MTVMSFKEYEDASYIECHQDLKKPHKKTTHYNLLIGYFASHSTDVFFFMGCVVSFFLCDGIVARG